MKHLRLLPLIAAGLLSSPGAAQTVYSNDFETPLGGEWSGPGTIQAPGTLPAGTFGQGHLYNNTTLTGDPGASVLALASLGAHTGLGLTFDFMAWNSWDGAVGPFPQNDIFEVLLDGVTVMSISPNNASGTAAIPPSATLTFGPAPYGFGDSSPYFDRDTVYRISLGNLAHAAGNATFSFRVNGVGWQGGGDEAFGLDNLRVSLVGAQGAVPEPATWLTLILGFGLVGAGLRARHSALRSYAMT